MEENNVKKNIKISLSIFQQKKHQLANCCRLCRRVKLQRKQNTINNTVLVSSVLLFSFFKSFLNLGKFLLVLYLSLPFLCSFLSVEILLKLNSLKFKVVFYSEKLSYVLLNNDKVEKDKGRHVYFEQPEERIVSKCIFKQFWVYLTLEDLLKVFFLLRYIIKVIDWLYLCNCLDKNFSGSFHNTKET